MTPDLFDFSPPRYPETPGYRDRETSREAAQAIEDRAPTLRSRCLALVRQAGPQGCTADEVADRLNETVLSIRPRFTELLKLGEIEDSGQRRSNASGRRAKVMIAARRGN